MRTALHPFQFAARHAAGFTLIELLVAISIMATVLAAMTSVLYTAFRLSDHMNVSLDQSAPVESALTCIQRDLANVICSPNPTNAGMLIGPLQSVNQTNVLPNQIGPDFYTTGGELDGMAPWGDIEKVDYLLTPGTNRMVQGKDLVRAVTRNLLQVNSPAVPELKRTILSGVQSVVFTYYDGNSWQPQWDTTQQTNLPYALKMLIQMAPQGFGRVLTRPPAYELVIPLDVQVTTNAPGTMQ